MLRISIVALIAFAFSANIILASAAQPVSSQMPIEVRSVAELRQFLTDPDPAQRGNAVRALRKRGGDEAIVLLFAFLADRDSKIVGETLAALENRRLSPGYVLPADVATSATQALKGLIRDSTKAGMASRVYAVVDQVPGNERADCILERYIREVRAPRSNRPALASYVSEDAVRLNQFLISFSAIGSDAIPPIAKALDSAKTPEDRLWLTIAAGFAGDANQKTQLRKLFDKEKDRSTQSLILRAYAGAAKKKAIPLLESLKAKTAKPIAPPDMPVDPVAVVSRDELWRLTH
jgi:HEAT repeat protein